MRTTGTKPPPPSVTKTTGTDKQLKDRCKTNLGRAVELGYVVYPTSCVDGCGRPHTRIYAHHPDLTRCLEVKWYCPSCYRKVNVPARMNRGPELVRKCPDYVTMREDFVVHGMSYAQMAQRYGIAQPSTVQRTLRLRAQRRGEWPLTQFRAAEGHSINPGHIAELLREYIDREVTKQPVVKVACGAAAKFAPYTTRAIVQRKSGTVYIQRRHHKRITDPPLMHNLNCHLLVDMTTKIPVRTFLIDDEEGARWGYQECRKCRLQPQIRRFCRVHGFHPQWISRLYHDRVNRLTRMQAIRVLRAIGEPVPGWMRTRSAA